MIHSSTPSSWTTTSGATRNSEATGGVMSSLEMLNLPGMVVSFVIDDSQTFSSGSKTPTLERYIGGRTGIVDVTIGSTDSSVLNAGVAGFHGKRGIPAASAQSKLDKDACLSLTAVLLALGGVAELLLEVMGKDEAHNSSSVE